MALSADIPTAPWWVVVLEAAEGIKAPWEIPGNWLVWWYRWSILRDERIKAVNKVNKESRRKRR